MNEGHESGLAQAREVLRKLNLTEEMVRAHVIRPPDLTGVATGPEHGESAPATARSSVHFYRLDARGFANELHALLKDCVVGYSMQLRRNGRVVVSRQFQSARTPGDGDLAWTAAVPMHVASVSKLITAMAMTKVLAGRGLSVDSPIAPWLPRYWQIGPSADRISFRHLLTHTSGLNYLGDITPSDLIFMRQQVAQGVPNLGKKPSYTNMNFGLCRILISTLCGGVPVGADLGELSLNDHFWDNVSITYYRSYVHEHIFRPSGVSAPTLEHTAAGALAYKFPVVEPGWDSGDTSTMSGGCGWHMSTSDLLDVMGSFRRRGTIVSPAQAQAMLDSEFGIDVPLAGSADSLLGWIYAKGGKWSDHGRVEQSNAYFLPKGMELVVLANSPFCKDSDTFMEKVTAAIHNNIKLDLFSLLAGIYWSVRDLVTRERARIPR